MDGLEVLVPAKHMGSEGCGGVRVSSNKADHNGADSSLWLKLMHSHDFVHDRLTKLRVENSSSYVPIASPESAESPRKRGKLSKRSRLIILDDTVRENDTKEICGQGSTHSDKPVVVKQRNSCNGRRGDKRNSKVPTGENAFTISPQLGSFTMAS